MQLNGQTFRSLYTPLIASLLDAERVSPRGDPTRELRHVQLILENPRARLMYHPKRKFNLLFAIAETTMLHSTDNSVDAISAFNAQIKRFSDDGQTMHGSYGARVATLIPEVMGRLTLEPSTRQAVLPIYRAEDFASGSKDIPCTLSLHFLLRNGTLDLHTYMRSNDAIWGLPYDLFSFTCLQESIANSIGAQLGRYVHSATSLHLYDRHRELAAEILDGGEDVEFTAPETEAEMYMTAQWYTLSALAGVPKLNCPSTPFATLMRNEFEYRRAGTGQGVEPAITWGNDLKWAAPFVKRWFK